MAIYKYTIKTTNAEAEGTIEAGNEAEAEQKLSAQYVPKDTFKDPEGNKVKHEVVEINVQPYND